MGSREGIIMARIMRSQLEVIISKLAFIVLPVVCISASAAFVQEAAGSEATLILAIGNIRHDVSGGYNYYYFDQVIVETNGVGVTLTSWQLCNETTGWCGSEHPENYRIEANGQLYLPDAYYATTSSSGGTIVVASWGRDDDGNAVRVTQTFDYPPSSTSGDSVVDYVTRLYRVVLQREPDPPGLDHNVNLCYSFWEVKTVTAGFLFSPEFLGGIGADVEVFVIALYEVALDRDPDAPGLAHNIGLITSGQLSRADLVDGFLNTPEFVSKDPFLFISPEAPTTPVPPELTPAGDLTGTWTGSGTFTDNNTNPGCTWGQSLYPPTITMVLTQSGTTVTGTVTLDYPVGTPNIGGWECSALQGTSAIINGTVGGSRFTFTDSGGNFWSLSFTTDTLGGTVSNSVPGVGLKSGRVSLTRAR